MRPSPNNIIVFISEEERRKLFGKPIITNTGEKLWLSIAIPPEGNEDGAGEHTITTGKVVAVGKNVKGILPGDDAVIDYMVDLEERYIISSDAESKFVSINAITEEHEEDCVIDANRRTPHPTVMWRKGEYNEISPLIAIVRDGVIIPNRPYIILTHEDEKMRQSDFGIVYMERATAVERNIIATYEGCHKDIGTRVLVEEEAIFPREINGMEIDVVFEADILGSIPQSKFASWATGQGGY